MALGVRLRLVTTIGNDVVLQRVRLCPTRAERGGPYIHCIANLEGASI